jgi:hypothetical protein
VGEGAGQRAGGRAWKRVTRTMDRLTEGEREEREIERGEKG